MYGLVSCQLKQERQNEMQALNYYFYLIYYYEWTHKVSNKQNINKSANEAFMGERVLKDRTGDTSIKV